MKRLIPLLLFFFLFSVSPVQAKFIDYAMSPPTISEVLLKGETTSTQVMIFRDTDQGQSKMDILIDENLSGIIRSDIEKELVFEDGEKYSVYEFDIETGHLDLGEHSGLITFLDQNPVNTGTGSSVIFGVSLKFSVSVVDELPPELRPLDVSEGGHAGTLLSIAPAQTMLDEAGDVTGFTMMFTNTSEDYLTNIPYQYELLFDGRVFRTGSGMVATLVEPGAEHILTFPAPDLGFAGEYTLKMIIGQEQVDQVFLIEGRSSKEVPWLVVLGIGLGSMSFFLGVYLLSFGRLKRKR